MYLHGIARGTWPRHHRVLRLRRRPVRRIGDHPPHHPVAGRAPALRQPVAGRRRLRLLLRRWDPLQRPAGRGAAVRPGDRGGAGRRDQGAGGHLRRPGRESSGAWADLLRDAKRRGMRAPVVMVGDGALGLWSALGEVFPETRDQRCSGPQGRQRPLGAAEVGPSVQPAGPWRRSATRARTAPRPGGDHGFRRRVRGEVAKAVAKITEDRDELLCFFDFPLEHWIHLKTTNPSSRLSPPCA